MTSNLKWKHLKDVKVLHFTICLSSMSKSMSGIILASFLWRISQRWLGLLNWATGWVYLSLFCIHSNWTERDSSSFWRETCRKFLKLWCKDSVFPEEQSCNNWGFNCSMMVGVFTFRSINQSGCRCRTRISFKEMKNQIVLFFYIYIFKNKKQFCWKFIYIKKCGNMNNMLPNENKNMFVIASGYVFYILVFCFSPSVLSVLKLYSPFRLSFCP